jgi:hypothetical protein
MRGKGINYDTGFTPFGDSSRKSFDPEVVRRELQVVAEDLHCNAVRISGGDPDRLTIAAEHAARAGLEVWYSPFPVDMTAEELLPFFADCAERAERVRCTGAEVVLVTGCEMSLFAKGFVPGDDLGGRFANIGSPTPEMGEAWKELPARMNAFMAEAAATARKHFGGRVTYASGPWEDLDWTPFDIVSVDAYRDESNASGFEEDLRKRLTEGKPLVATEFGCCTYEGAGAKGGLGWTIVERDDDGQGFINGDYVRDEGEQVTYLHDLLPVFERVGFDAAFWFTFAGYDLPHRSDPRRDLDMASYGVVKILDGGYGTGYAGLGWEPKEVFHALARAYAPEYP